MQLGVLEAIVSLLEDNGPPTKLNGANNGTSIVAMRPLADDEVIRLQALEVLAIFASGKHSNYHLITYSELADTDSS